MTIIDTHSHIYLTEFEADRSYVTERAEKEGVVKILLPAIDSSTHKSMLELEEKMPSAYLSMMGLHPCSVKEDYKKELKIAEDFMARRIFKGVGETGLDFFWDTSFKDQQYEAFHQQIEWALQYDLPVVIHSRNSLDECIGVIKDHQKGRLKGVFHCFSGNSSQAQQIIDLGFYMGIGGVLTFKNSGLDKVTENLDLQNIVLETDAPYLAPVPFRGKRNEPAYLKYIIEKLSEIKEADKNEIASVTTANAEKLFGKL